MPKAFGVTDYSMSLKERLVMLVEMVGGTGKAASIASVSRDTVNNWKTKNSRIPLMEMLALSKAAGVSLDWVATGYMIRSDLKVSQTPAGIDMELLQACIQGTEEHLAEAGQVIDSQNKALIVANLYSLRVKERKAATEKSDVVEADGSNQSRVG